MAALLVWSLWLLSPARGAYAAIAAGAAPTPAPAAGHAAHHAHPAPPPDRITFTNGDELSGKLVKLVGTSVTFHSDVLGDFTVPLAKVKALHVTQSFAVIQKNQKLTRRTAVAKVPVGHVSLANDTVTVTPPKAAPSSFPLKNTKYMIDASGFNREIRGETSLLYGWTGSVTLGATLVQATNSAQTYTGAVALVRTIPKTNWLPPASKTTLNLSATYGLAEDPEIIADGAVVQTPSTTKTDILHGDTEYDRYLSTPIFALVSASADHNYGNGLQLQQSYGAGVGWSVINKTKNMFDIKGNLQYQQQQFYNSLSSGLGTPTANLIGAAVTETWHRTFAHNIKFNEYVTLIPTFNITRAYSAAANTAFIFPVYKKFNFTLSSTDNYLGDPPGGYLRNTFQLTAGVTYSLK